MPGAKAGSRCRASAAAGAVVPRLCAGAGSGAATWVDTSLQEWITANGGEAAGAQLVYSRSAAGGVSRTLVAARVRA